MKYLQITISTDDFLNKWGQNGQSFVKTCCPYLTTLVSGSPIIQNGKLVGAVTHVMVANPTEGYGIFILPASFGGLPWANVVRSTKGDWRTCAEKE